MKKIFARVLSVLLCAALLCAIPAYATEAGTNGSAQINSHQTSLRKGTDGCLYILTSVTTNRFMNTLGVTSVELQKLSGSDWEVEYTYLPSEFPTMLGSNEATHTITLTYWPSSKPATYRVMAYYYAESDTMISTVTSASRSVTYP